ncbi:MAG: CRISPR-associated endonuclease Cas2 [bacterium]|nr:CRISPR-associated endonuclease Cas2 [bacterium]
MGTLEGRNAKIIRRTKVNNAIIGTVAIAGLIAVAAVAPNVMGVLGRSTYARQRLFQTRSRISAIIQAGYLVVERHDGTSYVRLTEKGERFAALMHEGKLAPKKPKRWDGKWRLLIFDIPERRRRVRTNIRKTLVMLGFVRLQDSVWAYPYDCEDYIAILKADFKIGKDVLYIIADQVEYDAPLRAHFTLPNSA